MEKFDYTVETAKSVDEAVKVIEAKAQEKGFRVLYIHDVQATLAAKGFHIEPMKIIEVCNAGYASQVLAKDKKISLMLPCPISVFARQARPTSVPSSHESLRISTPTWMSRASQQKWNELY